MSTNAILISKYRAIKRLIKQRVENQQLNKIFKKFSNFTMIRREEYLKNLLLSKKVLSINGAIIECGVWRGGMIAGLANMFGPERNYYLFDSFEGLPPVSEIDGVEAKQWQADKMSPYYFDNCKAEMKYAQEAMRLALGGIESNVFLFKGWFNETLNNNNFNGDIALLRLDGDWYDSTIVCLDFLFPRVVSGGLIIIDDYHTWEGCTKAVHDYLSKNNRDEKICQFQNSTAYLIKI